MQRISLPRFLNFIVFLVLVVLLLYNWFSPCHDLDTPRMVPKDPTKVVYDAKNRAYSYDRQMPLIFIGGIPRSGTTLMRAMMDAHPDIRCGEETRVIPRLLGMRSLWAKSEKESRRLKEAGLSNDVIDSALSAFILEVIAKHGEPAPYLCNKDPFTLKSLVYLSQMFPHAKFILMVRDGRAVVNSIISRKVTITGFNLKSFRQCLEKWNAGIETMYVQCLFVGPSRCMPVYYEQLVLHPREVTLQVLKFLDIPWHDAVLHHSDFVNMPGGISLSKVERSTDQVIKPINVEALTKWVTSVPTDVRQDIDKIAPMLQRLGYDSHAYPPKYGTADDMVARNTYLIQQNGEYWIRKTDDIQKQEKLVSPMAANGIFKYVSKNGTKVGRPVQPMIPNGDAAIDEEQIGSHGDQPHQQPDDFS